MVDVADREPQRALGAEKDQRVEESDRVGAARDAYEDVVSCLEEPPGAHPFPNGGEQR
jgi:hypothetical protein